MKKKIRNTVLVRNQPIPIKVPIHVEGQGSASQGRKCHPPRKIIVKIADPTTMWAYSATKKMPNLKPPYSV
jgi:hypothetical protein